MIRVKGNVQITGVVLIFLAVAIYVLSLPALVNATDTSANSSLENESEAVKTIYQLDSIVVAILPLFMILLGMGMMVKG